MVQLNQCAALSAELADSLHQMSELGARSGASEAINVNVESITLFSQLNCAFTVNSDDKPRVVEPEKRGEWTRAIVRRGVSLIRDRATPSRPIISAHTTVRAEERL